MENPDTEQPLKKKKPTTTTKKKTKRDSQNFNTAVKRE